MASRTLADDDLADLRTRVAAKADAANDPDVRDDALLLIAALDELAEHRRRQKSQIDEYAISGRLRRAIAAAGGQAAFRRAHPMSQGLLSDALRGREAVPGPTVLQAIGVRKRVVTVYEVVDEAEAPPAPRSAPRHPAFHPREEGLTA